MDQTTQTHPVYAATVIAMALGGVPWLQAMYVKRSIPMLVVSSVRLQ